ncbi:FAD/NAD(P)-binding domain-containing protein [Polyplosphaeria fusca]|uniref:FAD/NAD(P)-binding domain-containing protein n=1 Tax=Polyplosphaeria fusca TaxID=682080 RepID=A0A9P4QNA6_9PLEO|nr:FAD/NAD(P)-binding domain-containing protein [Polyplosphaeria fusca]
MPPPPLLETLILGAGPAGLAAALLCARGRISALVFDSQSYRNAGITHMHSVPSRDHIDPREFRAISRDQITSRYDSVWFEDTTIVGIVPVKVGERGKWDGFEVKDEQGRTWVGRKVVLATGARDVFPSIEGYAENWPSHIYQCLACDGFEQRGTPIGILEFDSPMAAHYVSMAYKFDERVTVFGNGEISAREEVQGALRKARAMGARVDERRIRRLVNNGPSHTDGVTIEFEEGESVTLGFLVNRPPTVLRAKELVEQLGLETKEDPMSGEVVVVKDVMNATSVKGVFAAGDTMAMFKQVTVAMAEGLKAAAGAAMALEGEDVEEALKAYEQEQS